MRTHITSTRMEVTMEWNDTIIDVKVQSWPCNLLLFFYKLWPSLFVTEGSKISILFSMFCYFVCGIASSVRHPVYSKPTCCRAVAGRRKMYSYLSGLPSCRTTQLFQLPNLMLTNAGATCLSCQLFCSKLRYLCILDETEERIPCSCSQRSQRHAKLFKLICHAGLSIILATQANGMA